MDKKKSTFILIFKGAYSNIIGQVNRDSKYGLFQQILRERVNYKRKSVINKVGIAMIIVKLQSELVSLEEEREKIFAQNFIQVIIGQNVVQVIFGLNCINIIFDEKSVKNQI